MSAGRPHLLVAALALSIAGPAAALDIEKLDANTVAALTADGPLVAIDDTADGRLEMATAAIVIDAPPQAVWDVLVDFASYPEWMPQVTAADVLSSEDGVSQVRLQLEFDLVIAKKIGYTLAYRDAGDLRMEYDLIDGDLTTNEGYWVVRPYGDHSILYYANYCDYTAIKLLRAFLRQQPTLELAFGASSVAVIARAVKQRLEAP